MRTRVITRTRLNSRVCLDTQSVSSNPPQTAMNWMVFPWLSVTVGEVETQDVDQQWPMLANIVEKNK